MVQVSGGTREILSPAGLPCAAAATISVSVSGGVSFGPRPEHLLLGDRRLPSSASPAASPSAPSLSIQNSDQLRSQSRRARGGRRWWLGLPRPQAFFSQQSAPLRSWQPPRPAAEDALRREEPGERAACVSRHAARRRAGRRPVVVGGAKSAGGGRCGGLIG